MKKIKELEQPKQKNISVIDQEILKTVNTQLVSSLTTEMIAHFAEDIEKLLLIDIDFPIQKKPAGKNGRLADLDKSLEYQFLVSQLKKEVKRLHTFEAKANSNQLNGLKMNQDQPQ
jgi:hypothetical protein